MQDKIAVEEHYDLPPVAAAGNNAFKQSYVDDVQDRLHNRDARLREMDAFGIGYSVLSLTEPGVQDERFWPLWEAVEALEVPMTCRAQHPLKASQCQPLTRCRDTRMQVSIFEKIST
jgi:hypothetical protein